MWLYAKFSLLAEGNLLIFLWATIVYKDTWIYDMYGTNELNIGGFCVFLVIISLSEKIRDDFF